MIVETLGLREITRKICTKRRGPKFEGVAKEVGLRGIEEIVKEFEEKSHLQYQMPVSNQIG